MRDYARQQTAILLRRFAFQVSRTGRFGTPDSIHDLRVSIRRLSRCLRVFAQFYPDPSWQGIRKQLRSLMELAGAVRDRDIALELLEGAGIPPSAPIVDRLRAERRQTATDLAIAIRRWKSRNFSQKWRSRLEL